MQFLHHGDRPQASPRMIRIMFVGVALGVLLVIATTAVFLLD